MGCCGTPGKDILVAAAAAAAEPPVLAGAAGGLSLLLKSIAPCIVAVSSTCLSSINLVKVSSNCSWLSSAFESCELLPLPLLYLQCLIPTQCG